MGTSVATELMARDLSGELDIQLAGAMLFNGSMLLHLARPTFGQKLLRSRLGPVFARLTSERTFKAQFGRIFSPDHPLSAEEAADQWSLLTHDGGARIAHRTINYMAERERFTDRWHGAIRDWPGAADPGLGIARPRRAYRGPPRPPGVAPGSEHDRAARRRPLPQIEDTGGDRRRPRHRPRTRGYQWASTRRMTGKP